MSCWIAKHRQPRSFNLCTKFGYLQSISKDFYRKKETSATSIMNIDIRCMTPLEPILEIQLMLGFCVGRQKQRIQAEHGIIIIHLGTIHKHALNLKFFFALNLPRFCFLIPWFYCLVSEWFKPRWVNTYIVYKINRNQVNVPITMIDINNDFFILL